MKVSLLSWQRVPCDRQDGEASSQVVHPTHAPHHPFQVRQMIPCKV